MNTLALLKQAIDSFRPTTDSTGSTLEPPGPVMDQHSSRDPLASEGRNSLGENTASTEGSQVFVEKTTPGSYSDFISHNFASWHAANSGHLCPLSKAEWQSGFETLGMHLDRNGARLTQDHGSPTLDKADQEGLRLVGDIIEGMPYVGVQWKLATGRVTMPFWRSATTTDWVLDQPQSLE